MGVVDIIPHDPAYPIIERLRREQRNARRRVVHAASLPSTAAPPTAQWVRAEYRAEMRRLHRPLRVITARNALEWAHALSSLRRQDGEATPTIVTPTMTTTATAPSAVVATPLATTTTRRSRAPVPRRCRHAVLRHPAKPTAEWTRTEYRAEMAQLGLAQRTVTARDVLRWVHILSSVRRRRLATLRQTFERLYSTPVAFPIVELVAQYKARIATFTDEACRAPHRIVLTSAVVQTPPRAMDVANAWHGAQWLAQLVDDDIEYDSQGNSWVGMSAGKEAFAELFLHVEPIQGGCLQHRPGRCHTRTVHTPSYRLETYCPHARNNDCAFECLRHLASKHGVTIAPTNLQLRKEHRLPAKAMVGVDTLLALCTRFLPHRRVVVATTDLDDAPDMATTDYIVLQNEHYQVVESLERHVTTSAATDAPTEGGDGGRSKSKKKRITRGVLAMDFETRPSFENPTRIRRRVLEPLTGETTTRIVHSHRLVDTICHARYHQNGDRTDLPSSPGLRHVDFTTNRTASSARQFLDWLKDEAQTHERHYQVVAYNGSRFDYYLLLGAMTAEETRMLEPTLQLRGKAIIGFELYGCLFKDPNLFLTGSLDHNCKAFKVNCAKQTAFTLANGTTVDNMQLCFYQPTLDVWDFLDLQRTEPDFWRLYMTYCDLDCGALYALWKTFRQSMDALTEQMGGTELLAKCRLVGSCTIGSHSKKLLTALNRHNPAFHRYEAFFYGHDREVGWTEADFDASVRRRYAFISQCKRGGISHVQQPGKHDESVVGVDIVSQYPTALVNMTLPVGRSRWVKAYDPTMHGYYEVRRLRFANDDGRRKRFRPIAYKGKNGESLDWRHVWSEPRTRDESIHLDSQMLAYLMREGGLVDFEVVEGLVSRHSCRGAELFARYVTPVYNEKARQDELLQAACETFNVAMREACKLLLNSLTGKLVEDSSRYYQLAFTNGAPADGATSLRRKGTQLNGVDVVKVYNRAPTDSAESDETRGWAWNRLPDVNVWVGAGVGVYSYSKILLFKYIQLLPGQADDVIHVETDGIYFPARCLPAFEANLAKVTPDPCFPLALGSRLGNLKVESVSVGTSYWLGKKFYYYATASKEVMRIKGIPQTTLAEDGTRVALVDRRMYEEVFAGRSVVKEYATLTKHFFGKEVQIQAHRTRRTVRPMCMYGVYA